MQWTQNSRDNLEKEQKRTHFLVSKLITELQVIKKIGSIKWTDIQINGLDWRVHR